MFRHRVREERTFFVVASTLRTSFASSVLIRTIKAVPTSWPERRRM